jgi:hypothetical protein
VQLQCRGKVLAVRRRIQGVRRLRVTRHDSERCLAALVARWGRAGWAWVCESNRAAAPVEYAQAAIHSGASGVRPRLLRCLFLQRPGCLAPRAPRNAWWRRRRTLA